MKHVLFTFFAVAGSAGAAAPIWQVDRFESVPEFSSLEYLPGQGFETRFFAPPGTYEIQFSTDLTVNSFGSPVQVEAVDGEGVYLDASALGRDKGFYRIGGIFRSEGYHSIAAAFVLEEYEEEGILSGDLIGEVVSKDAILEYRETEEAGGIMYLDPGFLFQQYITPSMDDLGGFSGFIDDLEQVSTTFPEDGLRLDIPAGEYELPYGDAFRFASVQNFTELDEGRGALVAGTISEYGSLPEDEIQFYGTKLTFPFLFQKSVSADATDLEGNWGMLNITLGGDVSRDENGASDGPVSAFYGLYASVANVQADGVGGGDLNITRRFDFEVFEEFDDVLGYFADADSSMSNEQVSLPFSLLADASIAWTDDNGDAFFGAVSPSASLIVATSAFPDELDDEFLTDPVVTEQQLVVAVKREQNPALAGRSFAVTNFGFYVNLLEDPGFELYRGNPSGRIDFSADGHTALLTVSQDYRSLTLDGQYVPEQYDFTVDLEVEVQGDGTILLTDDGASGVTSLVGFARQGSDLLILGNTYEDDGFYYEIGLMLLTPVN